MEDVGFEEDSFLSMLNSGEEESYLFCAPSSVSSPSSTCCYSSYKGAAQMLCFGGKVKEEEIIPFHEIGGKVKSSDSSVSSLSSSPQSTNTSTTVKNTKATKKKEGSGSGGRRSSSVSTTSTAVTTTKKAKTEPSSGQGTVKARNEKLGERILTLQQLVSPFGKSDTASVLHEALGYIRFLHDQVQVLSSPYLQGVPTSDHLHVTKDERGSGNNNLRSRGLCLVPIACTEHVVSSNGADLWSPAMESSNNCPFSSKP